MAENTSKSSGECSVVSVPSSYFQAISTFETVHTNDELMILSFGSNFVIFNENTSIKLGLKHKTRSNILWTFNFNLKYHTFENNLVLERLVQVVIDENIDDNVVVVSEDLFLNLEQRLGQELPCRITPSDEPSLILTNDSSEVITTPTKAIKVAIALLQSQAHLEDRFVDRLLEKYFSYPKYLCVGDLFSIHVDESDMLDLFNTVNGSTVYFKVCDLQGLPGSQSERSKGYLVDSSVTIYQIPNQQGFIPFKKMPLHYKTNLHSLLRDDNLKNDILTQHQRLAPPSFDGTFNTLCQWLEPFFCRPERIQGAELNPVFLVSGKSGSGKTLVVQALSQYFGVGYQRIDCVTVGGATPGQTEGKLKNFFNQLKKQAPCILHLANIQELCLDADSKEDVRVTNCFAQEVKSLKVKWPVVILATTHSIKDISASIIQLFLDSIPIHAPDCRQREGILTWLADCNSEPLDSNIVRDVASQTSGFTFRDLQVLCALAFKEKYKRTKDENNSSNLVLSDFLKIIGLMHKAYSEAIGAPKVPSVSWKDIGGLEHLKKEILQSLKSNMFNTGLKRSGLLLHGPPGTGKTLLAKAVATQCSLNFLSVKGPELLNMYVGQSEHNVRDLFELAKAASPCIVFFDELDSLAPNRGRSGDSGGVMDRVVSQLLAEMDDLGSAGDVFILGATNRPDLIDPALLRPGRLDKLLYVGPCEDRSSQLSVISAVTHKLSLEPDVDLQELVSLLPASVTGAQLSALCASAWMMSARQMIHSGENKLKTEVTVNKGHFLSAFSAVFNHQ